MRPLRLAASELRRLSASTLLKLALLAFALIPTIYAGLYLYANKDPYAAFPNLPAAVVSEDAGTTLSTGERLQVGGTVADHLVDSRSFDWHRVDRTQALDGVRSGRYDFAVIIPSSFSADLASSADFNPRQASLVLETNDANNYMTSMIGNTVIKEVSDSVASEVSETAASKLLAGFTTIHGQLGQAVDGAGQLSSGAASAHDGATQLADGAGTLESGLGRLQTGATQLADATGQARTGADQLASGADRLSAGLSTLDSKTSTLPSQTSRLAEGAAQVAAGNRKVAAIGDQAATASSRLRSQVATERPKILASLKAAGLTDAQIADVTQRLDSIDGYVSTADATVQQASADLDRLSAGADQVASGSRALANSMPALAGAVHQSATGAGQLRGGAQQLSSGLGRIDDGARQLATAAGQAGTGASTLHTGAVKLGDGLGQLQTGASQLHDKLAEGRNSIPNPSAAQRKATAQTIGSPLRVESDAMSRAGTYGAGLAPMFLSLSLWIGAYTIFLLVRPFSSRALATSQRSVRTALGGWLAPAAVGVVQVVALLAIVGLGLRIHVAHPVLALGFLVLVSASFVAIMHALASRLGAVGKFLGLVFMVVQLVSSGGTFPWQTLPRPLQAVHQVVPMSYAIDGLRRLMYGAQLDPLAGDVAVLVAYLVVALAVSTAAARRARVWDARRLKPDLVL
ncbi:MAG: YhgE/Pip family protein [Intrasporangium sp.]|uniref:YhgE/Pip family protein n=1 Tax=Intrasporangium sp. TaxID=1925024 RepID=UPI003F823199